MRYPKGDSPLKLMDSEDTGKLRHDNDVKYNDSLHNNTGTE